jgi:hypothetical protein
MRYVDAGYAVALSALLVYAVSLLARRRRWARAYEMSEPSDLGAPTVTDPGKRS